MMWNPAALAVPGMKRINSMNLNRKSGGAKPRDLRFLRPSSRQRLQPELLSAKVGKRADA
jgi:hypothetical protein